MVKGKKSTGLGNRLDVRSGDLFFPWKKTSIETKEIPPGPLSGMWPISKPVILGILV